VKTDHTAQTKHVPVRCEAENPHRCVGQTAQGQCCMLAMPHTWDSGKPLCPLHGTPPRPSLYRISNTEIADRMNDMRRNPQSYTLEHELALVRVLLETVLQQCDSAATLVVRSGHLLELTSQVERLLGANIKLAEKTNNLLSIEQVTEIAQSLIDIVAAQLENSYPEDATVVDGSTAIDHATFLSAVAVRFEETLTATYAPADTAPTPSTPSDPISGDNDTPNDNDEELED